MTADDNAGSDELSDEVARLKVERDVLIASIRDLTHSQLIGRDLELGLRAELMQAKIDLGNSRDRGVHDLYVTRRSTTWRVGRLVLKPVVFGRRVLKRITK